MIRLFLITLSAAVLGSCASAPSVSKDDLGNTVWTRVNNNDSQQSEQEGFYLAPDGSLLQFVGFGAAVTGWDLQDDRLVLTLPEGINGDLKTSGYSLRDRGGVLYLVSQTGDSLFASASYTPESLTGTWTITTLAGSDSLQNSPEKQPYLEILKEGDGLYLQGYGGVNRFRGNLSADGISWKSGPLMRTMMAGPALGYEDLLMKSLDLADTFISLNGSLYLYNGTELLVHLTTENQNR